MQGKIVAYSKAVNAGLILGTDGKNYPFARSEWRGTTLPQNNGRVNFIGETGRAQQVSNDLSPF
jgi:hypothetical protein